MASPMTIRSGFRTSRTRDVRAVAQDLVHGDQVAHERPDLGEHRLARERHVEQRPGQRPRRGDDLVLAREDLLQPPARDVGEREQAQRLAGGRAVDDEHVEVALLVVALELQQREQLVEAGGDRRAPRRRSCSRPGRRASRRATPAPRPSCAPSPAGPGPPGPTARRRPAAWSAPSSALERVGEAVGRVGGEHQRPQARRGAAPRRARGDRGLADAALAGVEDRARRSSERRVSAPADGTLARPPALTRRQSRRSPALLLALLARQRLWSRLRAARRATTRRTSSRRPSAATQRQERQVDLTLGVSGPRRSVPGLADAGLAAPARAVREPGRGQGPKFDLQRGDRRRRRQQTLGRRLDRHGPLLQGRRQGLRRAARAVRPVPAGLRPGAAALQAATRRARSAGWASTRSSG